MEIKWTIELKTFKEYLKSITCLKIKKVKRWLNVFVLYVEQNLYILQVIYLHIQIHAVQDDVVVLNHIGELKVAGSSPAWSTIKRVVRHRLVVMVAGREV